MPYIVWRKVIMLEHIERKEEPKMCPIWISFMQTEGKLLLIFLSCRFKVPIEYTTNSTAVSIFIET